MSTNQSAPSGATEIINFLGAIIVFAGVGAVVSAVAQASAAAPLRAAGGGL